MSCSPAELVYSVRLVRVGSLGFSTYKITAYAEIILLTSFPIWMPFVVAVVVSFFLPNGPV